MSYLVYIRSIKTNDPGDVQALMELKIAHRHIAEVRMQYSWFSLSQFPELLRNEQLPVDLSHSPRKTLTVEKPRFWLGKFFSIFKGITKYQWW